MYEKQPQKYATNFISKYMIVFVVKFNTEFKLSKKINVSFATDVLKNFQFFLNSTFLKPTCNKMVVRAKQPTFNEKTQTQLSLSTCCK